MYRESEKVMTSNYKQQINDWVASLEVKAERVLDIGGAQNPIKGRTKTWDVHDYKIMDLPIPHNNASKPDIPWDINDSFLDSYYTFQLIFCLGVFDFVYDPVTALLNIVLLLEQDGGEAWIQFPFVYSQHEPLDDEGLRYSLPCIKNLCSHTGLIIEDIVYIRPEGEGLVNFYKKERMSMAKDADHNVLGYIVKVKAE